MTDKQQEVLISDIIEMIERGNIEAILPFLESDSEIHICLGNQLYSDSFTATFMGPSGAENFLSLCDQFLDIYHITPSDFFHENNKTIVRGDMECQIMATGQVWSSRWMQIWTFSEGQVLKLRMFSDSETGSDVEKSQSDLKLSAVRPH